MSKSTESSKARPKLPEPFEVGFGLKDLVVSNLASLIGGVPRRTRLAVISDVQAATIWRPGDPANTVPALLKVIDKHLMSEADSYCLRRLGRAKKAIYSAAPFSEGWENGFYQQRGYFKWCTDLRLQEFGTRMWLCSSATGRRSTWRGALTIDYLGRLLPGGPSNWCELKVSFDGQTVTATFRVDEDRTETATAELMA